MTLNSLEMGRTGCQSSDGEGRHAFYFDKDLPRFCGVVLHRELRTVDNVC